MDTDTAEVNRGVIVELSCYNRVEQTLNPVHQDLVEFEHVKENVGYPNAFSRNIITELDRLPRKNRDSYIYRVDNRVREGNENYYEPLLFSIGPYNWGKSKLQHMEEHKLQSLNRIIEKVMEKRGISRSDQINRYYEVLKGTEDDARAYYAESINLERDDFLKMLLLDGCFLIESFSPEQSGFEEYDFSLRNMDWVVEILGHDLSLLENQLPFFVVNRLCEAMMSPEEYHPLMLLKSALSWVQATQYIRPPTLFIRDYLINEISADKLIPDTYNQPAVLQRQQELRQYAKNMGILDFPEIDPEKLQNTKHLLDLAYKVLLREDLLDVSVGTRISIMDRSFSDKILNMAYINKYSVTELSNAGVKFKVVTDKKFYDIQFKNGILEIPVIIIVAGQTEGLFRNLIAYERCSPNHGANKRRIVCDYINFMDSLINSGEDVELLRRHGIIECCIGDDEAVATVFNKMGTISDLSPEYYYSDIVKSLKDHCTKKKNIWMAKLRSDYFNGPWAIISVVAAFALLVLTIIQTVYSPLSYYKN